MRQLLMRARRTFTRGSVVPIDSEESTLKGLLLAELDQVLEDSWRLAFEANTITPKILVFLLNRLRALLEQVSRVHENGKTIHLTNPPADRFDLPRSILRYPRMSHSGDATRLGS